MKLLLLLLGLELFSSIINYSQTQNKKPVHLYYVSKTGDDKNPGTKTKPFKTINRVNPLKLGPGDGVYFNGGESFYGTLSINLNGSKNNQVVISSYGKGRAIINGGKKQSMLLAGKYFRVSNIDAKGGGRQENTSVGIQLIEANHAIIENATIAGFQKAGLDLYNCKNIVVRNVRSIRNGFSGIYVEGSNKKESKNILIKDCRAENNPGDPTNLTNHSGNGILVGMSDSVVIDHCTATNNGWDMPRTGNGPVGIWAYESEHVTIQYCISYRNRTAKGAKDGGGFDLDGGVSNSVIQYCLSYENEGAGYGLFQYSGASLWYNNIVRYCVSINDAASTEGSGGIFIWNNSDDSSQLADCLVHNNVVYSTHAPAIQFEPQSINKNFSFSNNIFFGNGEIINGPHSGDKFIGNVWWHAGSEITFRGYKTLSDWADATGQENLNGKTIGRQIDPLFRGPLLVMITDPHKLNSLSGYTLLSSSPLRNSGLKLQSLSRISFPSHDFYGNRVPQGNNPEPGIYEMKE